MRRLFLLCLVSLCFVILGCSSVPPIRTLDPNALTPASFPDHGISDVSGCLQDLTELDPAERAAESPYLWALALHGLRESADREAARELKLAFDRFVGFNVNFMERPVREWSTLLARTIDGPRPDVDLEIPPEWGAAGQDSEQGSAE